MNEVLIVPVAGLCFGGLSLVFAVFGFLRLRHFRAELKTRKEQVEELENSLQTYQTMLETLSLRVSDGARRVAWLETRVRQPKARVEQEEVVFENLPQNIIKPNITERRHRVLTLAQRGQDAETIAATLGMLPGEVELIVRLNRVAA